MGHSHDGSLKQVHVITRHGSRRQLPKDADSLSESETAIDSLLTPLGQQQQYQLGVWLREHYSNSSTTGFADNVLAEYDPIRVHVESSAYERTLVSAQSLLLGLFPSATRGLQLIPETPPVIPIYSKARHNDFDLRAYDKCPTYHDTLEKLYNTQTWRQMEFNSMHLLRKLALIPAFSEYAQHLDGEYIPLKDIWNVYDLIQVAMAECGTAGSYFYDACRDLPDPSVATSIQGEDWTAVRELAHAVELLKFGADMAESKVGGPLLDRIATRMDKYQGSAEQQKLYLYSAHYPTLLGLYAAMNIPFHEEGVIPEYASALIFEVHQGTEYWKFYVRIFYKSGTSTELSPIHLSDTCRTDVKDGCDLFSFLQEIRTRRLTPTEWCTACGNTKADACLQHQLELHHPAQSSCSSHNNSRYAAVYFAGMVSTLMILMVWNTFCKQRPTVRSSTKTDEFHDHVQPEEDFVQNHNGQPQQNGHEEEGVFVQNNGYPQNDAPVPPPVITSDAMLA
ncbi:Testicular acid phosphatase [Seminavis robusta]|uniref:Testicular acid phosphatase n=1 Tax=Seminavis robusta TaxID=568900 RepID=A0A9N8ESD7_9STRA|nr:Testicular acid phosphatase [Seminavis robusta]|eukprot:Sro1692_g291580.1 Testicular acid phosphatase (507) ;mRNA; r:21240-22760